MIFLTINNLNISIDKKPILKNISFSLRKGGTLAILGQSGSGKSTLLNTIAGFLRPTNGEIIFQDTLISSAHIHIRPEKRHISTVWQENTFLPHWTVEKNLRFVMPKHIRTPNAIADILQTIDLLGFEHRLPYTLSGGERQRLAFARALLVRPSLLLLDEPFASLDEGMKSKLINTFSSIIKKEKLSTILVTHSYKEALTLADTIMVIKDGEKIEEVPCHNCPMILHKTKHLKDIVDIHSIAHLSKQ